MSERRTVIGEAIASIWEENKKWKGQVRSEINASVEVRAAKVKNRNSVQFSAVPDIPSYLTFLLIYFY